jgi:hypothetical protein
VGKISHVLFVGVWLVVTEAATSILLFFLERMPPPRQFHPLREEERAATGAAAFHGKRADLVAVAGPVQVRDARLRRSRAPKERVAVLSPSGPQHKGAAVVVMAKGGAAQEEEEDTDDAEDRTGQDADLSKIGGDRTAPAS